PVTLGTTNSTNNNFGEIKAARLAGFVYLDANNDGIKEATEHGIPRVTLHLSGTDDTGAALALTGHTGSDGSYIFANLRPGNYTIAETQPAHFRQGRNTIGSLGGTVNGDDFLVN